MPTTPTLFSPCCYIHCRDCWVVPQRDGWSPVRSTHKGCRSTYPGTRAWIWVVWTLKDPREASQSRVNASMPCSFSFPLPKSDLNLHSHINWQHYLAWQSLQRLHSESLAVIRCLQQNLPCNPWQSPWQWEIQAFHVVNLCHGCREQQTSEAVLSICRGTPQLCGPVAGQGNKS